MRLDRKSCHRLLAGLSACLASVTAPPALAGSTAKTTLEAPSFVRTGASSDAVATIDPAARREDWRWLDRYPDDASHRRAEAAELQAVIAHLRQANGRLAELIEERKPLDSEAEFYKRKPLNQWPPWLLRSLEKSDSSFSALRNVFRLLEQDVDFIVAKYGNERGHLRKLWAGAPPGSIGFLKPIAAPSR
jgi:hypothetical protein